MQPFFFDVDKSRVLFVVQFVCVKCLRDEWVLTHNTENCSVHLGLGKEKRVDIQRMRFKLRPADSASGIQIPAKLSFTFSIAHGQPDQELV